MTKLLEQLTSQYDIVLIDTPPLLPVTDAAILAKITGGALVVAAADNLHRQQLADGLGSLEDVGARVLGVVLNRLAHKQNDAYSYYDYATAPATGAPSRRRRKRFSTSEPTQRRSASLRTHRSSSHPDQHNAAKTGPQAAPVSKADDDTPLAPSAIGVHTTGADPEK